MNYLRITFLQFRFLVVDYRVGLFIVAGLAAVVKFITMELQPCDERVSSMHKELLVAI